MIKENYYILTMMGYGEPPTNKQFYFNANGHTYAPHYIIVLHQFHFIFYILCVVPVSASISITIHK